MGEGGGERCHLPLEWVAGEEGTQLLSVGDGSRPGAVGVKAESAGCREGPGTPCVRTGCTWGSARSFPPACGPSASGQVSPRRSGGAVLAYLTPNQRHGAASRRKLAPEPRGGGGREGGQAEAPGRPWNFPRPRRRGETWVRLPPPVMCVLISKARLLLHAPPPFFDSRGYPG